MNTTFIITIITGPGLSKGGYCFHQTNHYQWIAWFVLLTLIHWITINLVDSVI